MLNAIKLTIAALLIAAFAVFVVQNLQVVDLAFLNRNATLSLAIPLVASYLLGGLTMRAVFRFLNNRRRDRKLRKQAQRKARAEFSTDAAR